MNKLLDKEPPPYTKFLSKNSRTGEYFDNYLIKSEYNYFYLAGKPFDEWILIGVGQ